VDERGSFYALV